MGDDLKHRQDREEIVPEIVEDEESSTDEARDVAGDELKALVEEKERELKALQDRLLRVAAESDNTRKRLEREKSDAIAYANESIIKGLLPVVDNLERAIQHSEKESNFESLLDGVRITLKSFLDSLAKFGCVPIESVGKSFDPNFHEAIAQQEDPTSPDMTVLLEFQKGYLLNDRLVRPASVVVSKGAKS